MKSILREKHRYIGLRIIAEREISKLQLQSTINTELIKTMGEVSFAKADPKTVYFGGDNTTVIIRCVHTQAEEVRAGLALITRIDGYKAHFMPVFTSGTILKCKTALAKKKPSDKRN